MSRIFTLLEIIAVSLLGKVAVHLLFCLGGVLPKKADYQQLEGNDFSAKRVE